MSQPTRERRPNAGNLDSSFVDLLDSVRKQAKETFFIVQFDDDNTWDVYNGGDGNWGCDALELLTRKVGDACRRKFKIGKNSPTWFDGKIVAIGPESKMKMKLAEYKSQLQTTRYPQLENSFVEDLDRHQQLVGIESSDDENQIPPSKKKKSSQSRVMDQQSSSQSSGFSLSPFVSTNVQSTSFVASTPMEHPTGKKTIQELLTMMVEESRRNGETNRKMCSAVTTLVQSVDRFSNAVTDSQKSMVKEYTQMRRDVRELKEVIRRQPGAATVPGEEEVSSEPVMFGEVNLVTASHSSKYGIFGRAIAKKLWDKSELMFKMISPRKNGRPPVSPTRKRLFERAIEQRFPGTGGEALATAKTSVGMLGNELRSKQRVDETEKSERRETAALAALDSSDLEGAARIRAEGKAERARIDAEYDVSQKLPDA